MTELTVIFFSCRRTHLLHKSIKAFLENVDYPIYDFIIVNDSADAKIHDDLRKYFPGATLVLNERNVGLMASIDNGYAHVQTEYFLHFEDDWCVKKGGFIEPALAIMESRADIEEVWFADYNNHPLDAETLSVGNIKYKLASENYQKGLNEINDNAWHGFTTACALKRISDYDRVKPYSDIPWEGTIWHREQAIGERYHQLGYRTACLLDEYVYNIGYGQSEYVTSNEL